MGYCVRILSLLDHSERQAIDFSVYHPLQYQSFPFITNYPMTVLLESFVIIYIVIVVQVVRTLDL